MIHKIIVAYDDSSEADRALDVAINLTKALHAELRIDLLVVGLRQNTPLIRTTAKEIAARSPCALLGVT